MLLKAVAVRQCEIDKLVFYYVDLQHNRCTSKMVVDSSQHVSSIVHDLNKLVRQDQNQFWDNFFFDIIMPTNFL